MFFSSDFLNPSFSDCSEYVPGTSNRNWNPPWVSEVIALCPVGPVIVTFAPGIRAPDGSKTDPNRFPFTADSADT